MLVAFPGGRLKSTAVEISGPAPAAPTPIDSGEHRARLIAKRNSLVETHLHLVPPIAAGVARRLPASFELDDLISAGNLGLMAAATKYDPAKRSQTRNTLAVMPFESYARPRIRGAILDSVRRGRYTDHTMAGLDEAPERTVAAVIDISIDRERRVAKMRASVAALPDRLRDTINVAYSKGEPDLRQIAKVLEIGASHASHLKSQALAKLRDDPTLREVKRA